MKKALKTAGAIFAAAVLSATAQGQDNTQKSQQPKAAASSESKGKESKDSKESASERPGIVIMHYAVATATGCWATFYDDENFKGVSVTLTGSKEMPDVEFDLKPYQFGGEPDSLVVGPSATLELYGDEEFKDKDHIFLAGERIDNLVNKPFWDNIESVRLKCTEAKSK